MIKIFSINKISAKLFSLIKTQIPQTNRNPLKKFGVNKVNFVKLYDNFVLKWLIFALYVIVVPEPILVESSTHDKC